MIMVLGGGFLGQHLRRRLIAADAALTIVSPRDLTRRGPAASHEECMLAQSFGGETVQVNGWHLPPMPGAQLQINTVGQAGAGAMEAAWAFAPQCLARFRTSTRFADQNKILLDFGTCWARIARCFRRDFCAENLIGVDVAPDFLAVCRATFHDRCFLHFNTVGVSGGCPWAGEFYGETFVAGGYAGRMLGASLHLVELCDWNGHPILFFNKLTP